MDKELTEERIIELLQGQWNFTALSKSFLIKGKEVVDIKGFGDVTEASYAIAEIENSHTHKWGITSPELNWVNEPIIELTEDILWLFNPAIGSDANGIESDTDTKYTRKDQ